MSLLQKEQIRGNLLTQIFYQVNSFRVSNKGFN